MHGPKFIPFDFNSILVQLEGNTIMGLNLKKIIFQFHIGAIRSLLHVTSVIIQTHFNSILVQLEVRSLSEKIGYSRNFNSILVQLEAG